MYLIYTCIDKFILHLSILFLIHNFILLLEWHLHRNLHRWCVCFWYRVLMNEFIFVIFSRFHRMFFMRRNQSPWDYWLRERHINWRGFLVWRSKCYCLFACFFRVSFNDNKYLVFYLFFLFSQYLFHHLFY